MSKINCRIVMKYEQVLRIQINESKEHIRVQTTIFIMGKHNNIEPAIKGDQQENIYAGKRINKAINLTPLLPTKSSLI